MFALAIEKMVISQVNYWLSFWQGNKMDRDKGKSTMGQVERYIQVSTQKIKGRPSYFSTFLEPYLASFWPHFIKKRCLCI